MVSIGVLRFPGTNNELEVMRVLRRYGAEPVLIPHYALQRVDEVDGFYVAGGFSYGDYLRAGAVAVQTEIMKKVKERVMKGSPILGVCNGFQILTEAGLLPGALTKNISTRFISKWVHVKVTAGNGVLGGINGKVLTLPIAHYEGNYYVDEKEVKGLLKNGQIVLQYSTRTGEVTSEANPNGSLLNIAGVQSKDGLVLGMMPHPERAFEEFHATRDGEFVIKGFIEVVKNAN